MEEILTDLELQRLHEEDLGFIYNDYGSKYGMGDTANVLHEASCGEIRKALVKDPKYFFDSLKDAVGWLSSERGREGVDWKRCERCFRL